MKSIVHSSRKDMVGRIRFPLYTPNTTSDVCFWQGRFHIPVIPNDQVFIITEMRKVSFFVFLLFQMIKFLIITKIRKVIQRCMVYEGLVTTLFKGILVETRPSCFQNIRCKNIVQHYLALCWFPMLLQYQSHTEYEMYNIYKTRCVCETRMPPPPPPYQRRIF